MVVSFKSGAVLMKVTWSEQRGSAGVLDFVDDWERDCVHPWSPGCLELLPPEEAKSNPKGAPCGGMGMSSLRGRGERGLPV